MRVLEQGEKDRVVRLFRETDGTKYAVCDWINCRGIDCEFCPVQEYIEESKKCFPDGLTYDEAKDYLEGK